MTPDDRQDVAVAILYWRYIDHRASIPWPSVARAERALQLAKLAGVFDEYWKLVQEGPILTVTVKELEP